MLPEVLGFTLTRTIPSKVLFGVLTGSYRVYGGVVRNSAGHIVAHLVNGVSPLSLTQPVNAVFGAVNTYQLHRIGRGVAQLKQGVGAIAENLAVLQAATNQLISLSTGTMLVSGLTLAVSMAGFAFLNKKLNKIDEKLEELKKDVKEIKDFLKMKQRSELIDALKVLQNVSDAPSEETRRQLLTQSRMTMGQLHQHYKAEFVNAATEGMVAASEEYFTITAIGQALCWAELDMFPTAAADLEDSYECWSAHCRKIAKEKLLRTDPERFLCRRYAASVSTDELIDWMEFAHGDEKGIGWIDELRAKPSKDSWWSKALSPEELLEMDLFRRLASRNRIYQGYCSQYQYFKDQKVRPSDHLYQIEKLDKSQMVEGTYLLVQKEVVEPDHGALDKEPEVVGSAKDG